MIYESKILNVTICKPKIHIVPDVVYAQVSTYEKPNQLLQMDLMIPDVTGKLPAIIFVTGRAFFAASINYRTVPNSKFPQPIEDVKSAIRFLKANAQKFNVDPEKIFVIGGSAGGYFTAMTAVTNGDKYWYQTEVFEVIEKFLTVHL